MQSVSDRSSADVYSSLRPQFEDVCRLVRIALEPVCVQAISLYDQSANLLWLTASVLNQEELVRDAFQGFASEVEPPLYMRDLGYSRRTVIFQVKGQRSNLIGAVMVVFKPAFDKTEESIVIHLLAAPVRQALSRFSVVLGGIKPQVLRRPPMNLSAMPPVALLAREASLATTRPPNAPATALISPVESPSKASDEARIAEPARPQAVSVSKRRRRRPVSLFVQRLVPLQKGSRVSRYELLWDVRRRPKGDGQGANGDAVNGPRVALEYRALLEVCTWLTRHPIIDQGGDLMLSLKLQDATLCSVEFRNSVRRCLKRYRHLRGAIGFEIQAATLRDQFNVVADAARSLHDLGCFLVLDNFTIRTECFRALQLPGLKLIKLAPRLTSKSRDDRVDGAALAGILGIARVLGIHTVVKRTRSLQELERLRREGFDFVQSQAVSPAVPIEALDRPYTEGRLRERF